MLIMIKKLIVQLLLIPLGLMSFSQIGTGEWRIHSENKNAKDVTSIGNSIFFAFDAAVLEYDDAYKEYARWDITNGLSDIKITTLGVHESSKSVFIGYENGNLDQMIDGRVTNIPGIKLASILGSKKINSIKSNGSFVYLATGLGVVKVDPRKNEIRDTYYPGESLEEIIEVTFKGDSIYALTSTKLYVGNLNNPALADPNQWSIDTRLADLSTTTNFVYKDIECLNDSLYFLKNYTGWGSDSVFVVRNSENANIIDLQDFGQLNSLQIDNGKLVMNGEGIVVVFNPDYSVHFITQNYNNGVQISTNKIKYFKDMYWFADINHGVLKRNFDGNFENLNFEGPGRNQFYSMDYQEGVLTVVPGAISGPTNYYYQPGLMVFEDEKWKTIGSANNPKWSAGNTWDIISVAVNSKNTNQIAVGGASKTPLSIIDKTSGTVTDTFGIHNSLLRNYINNSSYVTALNYDDDENLWITNGFTDSILKMKSKDGQWYSFYLGGATSNKQTNKMLYDYDGNIWISLFNTGLVGYNPGASKTSSTDDKRVLLTSNEYSGALPSNIVTAIAMDFDKELWIGTDNGFAILYNTQNAFDGSAGTYNVQRPKIDINGEVDYILGSTYINDIEVDGGNRKWIGTANSGMILLSDDGLTIIEHFTIENSPLISNNIIDLEINHKTGEIFIVTDKGIMSYRGDATYEDAEYSDVKVFPNPARPDFDGLITIQGIKFNSDIKITDVDGNLVYATTSNGGTATWNGKTVTGEKVTSGVYLIWTASNVNKGRFVGKVVVVN